MRHPVVLARSGGDGDLVGKRHAQAEGRLPIIARHDPRLAARGENGSAIYQPRKTRLPAVVVKGSLLRMTDAVEPIYEGGSLRLLQTLSLPEHTHVRLSVETLPDDPDRAAWLAQSERRLREVWDNEADDVFNELLTL